jgi:hypothetical protein
MVMHHDELYVLNPNATSIDLFDALNECLDKADALASLTVTDMFNDYLNETMRIYLWTLSHLIQEAQKLNIALSAYYFRQSSE